MPISENAREHLVKRIKAAKETIKQDARYQTVTVAEMLGDILVNQVAIMNALAELE